MAYSEMNPGCPVRFALLTHAAVQMANHNICQAALLCSSGNFLFEGMVFVEFCLDLASSVTSLKAEMLGFADLGNSSSTLM